MMHHPQLFSKLTFAFGAIYALIWALSILFLIPYYSSAAFSYSSYGGLPFMASLTSELSEHYIPLQLFFIALAVFLPLISIVTLSSTWTIRRLLGAVSKSRFIAQPLHIIAIMLAFASFIPMVWVLRELVVIEGPAVQTWFANAVPFLSSCVQASQGFVSVIIIASKGWMATYGSVGLLSAMVISSIISPIPNEVILAFAGMTMNPISVAIFGGIGSTVGG
jgi:hypothetical protein